MRHSLGLCVLMMLATSGASADELAAPVAQCIRDNAPKVEAAVADLDKAVDFLLQDVCAEPLAAEQARASKASSAEQSARWQKLCDENKTKGPKEKSTDISSLYCSSAKIGFLTEPDDGGWTLYAPSSIAEPPAARALAASLLLDIRLSHAQKAGAR